MLILRSFEMLKQDYGRSDSDSLLNKFQCVVTICYFIICVRCKLTFLFTEIENLLGRSFPLPHGLCHVNIQVLSVACRCSQ